MKKKLHMSPTHTMSGQRGPAQVLLTGTTRNEEILGVEGEDLGRFQPGGIVRLIDRKFMEDRFSKTMFVNEVGD